MVDHPGMYQVYILDHSPDVRRYDEDGHTIGDAFVIGIAGALYLDYVSIVPTSRAQAALQAARY